MPRLQNVVAFAIPVLLLAGPGAAQTVAPPPESRPAEAAKNDEASNDSMPGPALAKFDALVGRWDALLTVYGKEREPRRSIGVSRYHWVLEDPGEKRGRFLRQELRAEWNGQPYQGFGYWGYDQFRGFYTSAWMDSTATTMMLGAGSFNPDHRAFTLRGKHLAPDGTEHLVRMVLTIDSDDRHTFEQFLTSPDAPEHKSVEIVYTRVQVTPADDAERRRERSRERPAGAELPASPGIPGNHTPKDGGPVVNPPRSR
jgi:hypothetical protein